MNRRSPVKQADSDPPEPKTSDKIMGPMIDAETKVPLWKHEVIDMDGIAAPGARVKSRQQLVNKQMPTVTRDPLAAAAGDPAVALGPPTTEFKETPLVYKGVMDSYVESVMLTSTPTSVPLHPENST